MSKLHLSPDYGDPLCILHSPRVPTMGAMVPLSSGVAGVHYALCSAVAGRCLDKLEMIASEQPGLLTETGFLRSNC